MRHLSNMDTKSLCTPDSDSAEGNVQLEPEIDMNVSKINALPVVNADMSNDQLKEVLFTIESYIDDYGSNFSTNAEARKSASLKHKNIQTKLNQIKLIAAEWSCTDIVSLSSELETKLEAYKIKWSLMNVKGSLNTNNFHGFNSFDFIKAASNLPTSNNQQRLIYDLQQRISLLENQNSVVIQSQSFCADANNTISLLNKRIADLENKTSHHYKMLEELANIVQNHVDDLYSRIDSLAVCFKSTQSSPCHVDDLYSRMQWIVWKNV